MRWPRRRFMPDVSLAQLAARVGAFHITDRALKQAQRDLERALREGDVDDRTRGQFLSAARRYFDAFEKEAKANLRDVDRRLVDLNQVQFNLTAERGVAVKRIEAIEAVARDIAAVEETTAQ